MFIVIIVLSFGASALVRNWMTRTYSTWSNIPNKAGINGHSTARLILDHHGLQKVSLETSEGILSDHYVPSQKLMRLSHEIIQSPSVASLAVAAHECGHAIQDAEGYPWLKLKAVLMPFAAVGNQIGLVMAVGAGLVGSNFLLNLGLLLMLLGMMMPLLTLPIEFDASKRALQQLVSLKLVDEKEYDGAQSMLRAAAFTYVAGAASSTAILALIVMRMVRR